METPVQLPVPQSHPLRASPVLQELQRRGPVHAVLTSVGDPAWLVTGFDEVQSLLGDDRLGRSHPAPETAARSGQSALFGGPVGDYDTEQTDHARTRSLLQPHFSPKRMRALQPRVEALTNHLLDELDDRTERPVDLIEALALPLPILVICELLGVPYEDREEFRQWTCSAANVRDRARSERGLADLFAYGMRLVALKREEPGEDVISRLCATDGVEDGEIAALSMRLLFAGHETTMAQLGIGALLLLAHPDQQQALVDDPTLIPAAVEEMLRARAKGGSGIPRYARRDLNIGDATIKAGELVLLDTGAANHDTARFTSPDRFDATRARNGHLAFGHGARYCIGAPLARIELRAVFGQLLRRFPTLQLAVPVDELRLRTDTLAAGLVELPVTWT